MEILKILEESGESLYPEDLDFFETELATGGPYTQEYRQQCQEKINKLKAWLSGETGKAEEKQDEPNPNGTKLFVDYNNLWPPGVESPYLGVSLEEKIFSDIRKLRDDPIYRTAFKQYVADTSSIDAEFVDKNYSFFEPWELDAIISTRQMGEDFLEKYFNALDKKKLARYQLYSEAFFMKHYAEMDAETVLVHSKNEWRKKENRSKQLDVFLRLKGVKI